MLKEVPHPAILLLVLLKQLDGCLQAINGLRSGPSNHSMLGVIQLDARQAVLGNVATAATTTA